MRTAISPRFATSTFEKGATARILPVHGPGRPADARSGCCGAGRGRARPDLALGARLRTRRARAPPRPRDGALDALFGRFVQGLADSRVAPRTPTGDRNGVLEGKRVDL